MGRKARKNYDTSFFHVIVQGIKKEYIFKNDHYIEKYIKLMNKYESEFNLLILSYCIMNNHAHLLIYTKKIEDMSKFMHKVNSIYAEYFNYKEDERVGYVFRDRFKSQPIYDIGYLIKCINYIHLNPVKALIVSECENYKYSSYNYYLKNINNSVDNKINFIRKILGQNYMEVLNDNLKNTNIFYDVDTNLHNLIDNKILYFMERENIKINNIYENEEILRKIIKYLYFEENGIKRKDILQKFGIYKDLFYRLIK